MKAAADIGTAKLIGAIETSFMKVKKDTAIAHVEMITNELLATIPDGLTDGAGTKIVNLAMLPHTQRTGSTSPTVEAQIRTRTRGHFIGFRPRPQWFLPTQSEPPT